MIPGRAQGPQTARRMLGLSMQRLWLDYLSLGGTLRAADLEAFFNDRDVLSDHDHDMIVQALNEHFMDSGENHPLPYADELTAT